MLVFLLALLSSDPTIAGVVKDALGKPVEGAIVTVSSWTVDKAPETTTDAAGRYSMPMPPALASNRGTGAAVAFHPMHGFAVRELYYGDPSDFALQFEKISLPRIVIHDAEGKPLANAPVSAPNIHREYQTPPSLLVHASTKTNAEGVAEFANLSREQIGRLAVEVSPGVTQSFRAAAGLREWRTVRLSPMKTIKGRFVGAALPKGEEFLLETNSPRNRTNMSPVRVESRVRVAADGSFAGTTLTEGTCTPKFASNRFWVVEENKEMSPEVSDMTWTLKPTTPVAGIIQSEDGKPLANTLITIYTPTTGSVRMLTDERGRYSGRVPQGKRNRNVWAKSEFQAERWPTPVLEIPESETTVELPTIALRRSPTVVGIVTDENGKPAAGARVMAICSVNEGVGSSRTYPTGKSDAKGAFRVAGIPENASVTVQAFHPGRGTYATAVAAKPNDSDVKLKLDPAIAGTLQATVTDEAGRAIENARLKVDVQSADGDRGYWLRVLRPELQGEFNSAGAKAISLGALPKGFRYQISARADGFASATTPWIPGAELGSPVELKLRSLMQLVGRVVDSAGKPVAGAVVKPAGAYRSEATATTDSDGRFELSGFPAKTAVVTAHKSGWRFGGAVIATGTPAVIALKRPDEPAPRPMAAAFPQAKEKAEIGKRLTDPLSEKVFKGKETNKSWWGQSYAYHNPARMLELIDGPQWGAEERDFVRLHLATALAATDPDEALAQANAIGNAGDKAHTILGIAKRIPATDKAKRRALLADALTAARGGNDPALRTMQIAWIGEALMAEGDANGEKAIREAVDLAAKLPQESSAYAIGSTAESLALIDFSAAMRLTESLPGATGERVTKSGQGMDTMTFNRHRGNIAHKIAAKQPANAEEAFNSMKDATRKDNYAARVCYRMAPVDLPRAKRIAAVVREPADKATCLAVMAMALGPTRKAEALPMLRAAFNELAVSNSRTAYGQGPHALALLGFVSAVAPEEVDDFFWQAMAIPGPSAPSSNPIFEKEGRWGGLGIASLLCQRFSEEAAVAFAASLRVELSTIVDDLNDNRGREDPTLLALAAILTTHPDAGSDAIGRWPAITDDCRPQVAANRARMYLHSILSASPQRRNDKVLEQDLNQWVIDKEDL